MTGGQEFQIGHITSLTGIPKYCKPLLKTVPSMGEMPEDHVARAAFALN